MKINVYAYQNRNYCTKGWRRVERASLCVKVLQDAVTETLRRQREVKIADMHALVRTD